MMRKIPVEEIDLDMVEPVKGGLAIYKPYQGVTSYHGDKLRKDIKLSVVQKDER